MRSFVSWRLGAALAFLALVAGWSSASDIVINRIDLFSTNGVTIHFDTKPNLNYTLQYLDHLPGTAGQASPVAWSNIATIPAIPFSNHHVLVATRTNAHRFFRLLASP